MATKPRPNVPDFAGISRPVTEFDPNLFQGANFNRVNVPEVATVNESLSLTGVVGYDNPGRVISPIPVRVKMESPVLNNPKYSREFNMTHGQSRSFNLDLTAGGTEGETIAVTLKAQNKTVAGWQTTGNEGPFRIDIVSQGEATQAALADFIPFAVAGGAVGAVTSIDGTQGDQLQSAALGAGAGAVGKITLDEAEFSFSFPTVPILATAGLVGAGAFLLNESEQVGQLARQGLSAAEGRLRA